MDLSRYHIHGPQPEPSLVPAADTLLLNSHMSLVHRGNLSERGHLIEEHGFVNMCGCLDH